eukprot:c15310_g1_i1 orf=187-2136(-)
MNGDPKQQQQQHVEDSLSRLYKAHTVLADIMMQVDGLVLKAHKMSAHGQLCGLDLCSFSQFLADTASSLQEWIPCFEDATHKVPKEDQERKEKDNSTSLHKKNKRNDDEKTAHQDKPWSCAQSENLLDVMVDDTAFMDIENTLSDSPLVPWLDRAQFFVLTPMAKHKKTFSPVLLRRCSFKEQESLQSLPPPAITSPGVMHTCAETIPAPANMLPVLSCKFSESISDDLLVSASSTPSRLQPLDFESPGTMNIATPLPPQSLVKRYSNFFEADEHFADSPFADSPPMLLITPVVKKKQASQHKPAKEEDEDEGIEITEYFTAFSPTRLVKPHVSLSERGSCSLTLEPLLPQDQPAASMPHLCHEGLRQNAEHSTPLPSQSLMKRYSHVSMSERGSCSSTLEPLSPQDQAAASAPHLFHERLRRNAVEHSTPLPPQSLMKRYSQFLQAEEDGDEMMDSVMMLTPMLVSSPPKTCILMRPNHKEDTVKPRRMSQTPLLQLKSPFRTPGLFLKKAVDYSCYEDMDLASLKKPGHPPRHPETVRKTTPSSDMQFATIRRAPPASIRRTPLVDLQLSTVRKPGAPLPGEQTLKRELWCRMEAEFASITHVCKTLFTDNPGEASAVEVGRLSIENRQQKQGLFVPRGLQQRGLNR